MTATLTSREAADLLGVNIQKFHRLVAKYGIEPDFAAPGPRGARFWQPTDIDALCLTLNDGDAA